MFQIGQETCFITEMEDLQKIECGAFLLWILLQEEKIKQVEAFLLMVSSRRVPKLWTSSKQKLKMEIQDGLRDFVITLGK